MPTRPALCCLLACLLPGLLACSDAPPTEPLAGDASALPDGEAATVDDAAVGSPTDPQLLQVSLTADSSTLCRGECTSLRASTRGGGAPYAYQWSDGALPGESVVQVCPTADTRYELVARDTGALGGEFPRPAQQARASIALEVRDCTKPSADTKCSFEISAGPGPNPTPSDATHIQATGAIDPRGSLLVGGSFSGLLTLGGKQYDYTRQVAPNGFPKGFLAKFDGNCQPEWSKVLVDGPKDVRVLEVAADGAGNFAYSSIVVPEGGASGAGTVLQISKLASDGTLLYTRHFKGATELVSLHMNAQGEVAFMGVGSGVDYGAGPIGGSARRVNVIKLDAAGKTLLVYPFDDVLNGALALDDAGTVYLGGVADALNFGPIPLRSDDGRPVIYAGQLGLDGAVTWLRSRPYAAASAKHTVRSFITVDTQAGVTVAALERGEQRVPARATLWRLPFDIEGGAPANHELGFSTSLDSFFATSRGQVLVASQVEAAAGATDPHDSLRITAHDDQAVPVWSRPFPTIAGETLMHVSARDEQLVLMSGAQRSGNAGEPSRLFVRRLTPIAHPSARGGLRDHH